MTIVDQERSEHRGWNVGPLDRQPEDHCQDEEHQRKTEDATREQRIELPVEGEACPRQTPLLSLGRDRLGCCVCMLRDDVVEVSRKLPPQSCRRVQHPDAINLCGLPDLQPGFVMHQVTQFTGPYGFLDGLIRVEKSHRDPPRVGHVGESSGNHRLQIVDGAFDLRCMVLESVRSVLSLSRRNIVRRSEEFGNPDPLTRSTRNHRHPQRGLELSGINRDPMAPCLIHQIEEDDNPIRDVENLEDEIQVALEPGGIDYDHRHVRATEQHEVARDFFIQTARLKRIGAGKIDDLHAAPFVCEGTLGSNDRLPRPVPRVLAQTSQLIEDRALSDVRVPCERDEIIPAVGAESEPDEALSPVLCARDTGVSERNHQATPSLTNSSGPSIRIHSACSRRSAMSAPRMLYATGSPTALRKTASMVVPRTTPRSSSRRRCEP